jgi:hypothetical protein
MPRRPDKLLRDYWRWARRLAAANRRSSAVVFVELLAFKAWTGQGPQWYDALGLGKRGLAAYRTFLSVEDCQREMERLAPQAFRRIEEDKAVFVLECHRRGVPVVPIDAIVLVDAGGLAEWNGPILGTAAELERFLAERGEYDGIMKPIDGGRGYGLVRIAVKSGRMLPSKDFRDAAECLRHLTRVRPSRAYVLQPRVVPHPSLAGIMPGPGLGTFRVNTFLLRSGDVAVPWAFLKVPGPGLVHDNWRMGKGGGLLCPVDAQTGEIGAGSGRPAPTDLLRRYESHPVTGAPLQGVCPPHWQDVLGMVRAAALQFPELPALGWDVAVTPSGPVILEANWAWSIIAQQVVFARGLKDEFNALLRDVATPAVYKRPLEPA